MLVTKGFHHIELMSSDPARASAFYRDVLGLRVLTDDAPAYVGAGSGAPGTLIALAERRDGVQGRPGAGGIHHYALGTSTPEAQLKWKRRLIDAGVHVSGPYNRGWFHSIYFRDPDGHIVEIATSGPGYAVDEPTDALGSKVVVPPGAELRGERDESVVRARIHPEPVPVITPDMVLDGLHHISGMTDDVERIGEFYEEALGLRLVKRSVNQDDPTMPHWFWANYDGSTVAPHSSLTMFGSWSSGGARIPGRLKRAVAGVGQTHHIAFRATDDDELRGWMDRLRSMNVYTTDVIDRVHYRSFRFQAPDGLLMEIATDLPGFALAERRVA